MAMRQSWQKSVHCIMKCQLESILKGRTRAILWALLVKIITIDGTLVLSRDTEGRITSFPKLVVNVVEPEAFNESESKLTQSIRCNENKENTGGDEWV
ncbi:hypothetical protein ACFX14_013271 [Malus domestica]|uniref:Uncharacterized protein n=1 Tax=Malus domestica TaxID=3750 RepID=A0A498I695_MALDO|nr:hypothetical protein DVH24_002278 [Malus domestica]